MADASPPRLSVCIPTYNFGPYIGDTLRSILPQVTEDVEVVVLDGGSTDDTEQVVAELQCGCTALRYHRQDERGGIDRDMARTVELARGEYCWIFCADDLMKPGAVGRMLAHLESRSDLYLCGLTLCTREMQPIRDHAVARLRSERQFELSFRAERLDYLRRAQTTTALFSFAGSLIVSRARWVAAGQDERFVGSLWAHVARLLSMVPEGLRLHYLPDSYLLKRSDNDSFMDKGIVHRWAIAIDGYHRLAETFFPVRSAEARHMRRVVAAQFPPWGMAPMKYDGGLTRNEVAEVDRLAAKLYSDRTIRNLFYRGAYGIITRRLYMATRVPYRRVVVPVLRRLDAFRISR